jgi:hypothetical protein
MKKIVPKCLVFFFLAMGGLQVGAFCYATEVTLRSGTPIFLRLGEAISSESATAGQFVRLTVTRSVIVDGTVVVKAGSEVVGEVEGGIILVVRQATAVNGTKIPLRGGSTMIPVGTETKAYVDYDTNINVP